MDKVVWPRLEHGDELMTEKGKRHPDIIGKYGEYLVRYWLSRAGFEVVIVDYIGIDIIAYNPKTEQRLGITVKSRLRIVGKEKEDVSLLKSPTDQDNLDYACKIFLCIPCIGVYVETHSGGDLFLTSFEHYRNTYAGTRAENKTVSWKMDTSHVKSYMNDREISHIRFKFELNPVD